MARRKVESNLTTQEEASLRASRKRSKAKSTTQSKPIPGLIHLREAAWNDPIYTRGAFVGMTRLQPGPDAPAKSSAPAPAPPQHTEPVNTQVDSNSKGGVCDQKRD